MNIVLLLNPRIPRPAVAQEWSLGSAEPRLVAPNDLRKRGKKTRLLTCYPCCFHVSCTVHTSCNIGIDIYQLVTNLFALRLPAD